MSNRIITIIGGRGNMGRIFSTWWSNYGFEVRILEREDWYRASLLLAGANAVIVSVPIHLTKNVIIDLGKVLDRNTVLADLTSIQAMPLDAMMSAHHGPVVSLHPMFGPTVDQPSGNTIVVSLGRKQNECQWLIDSLNNLGFVCQNVDANTHDRAMDFIQGLEHFTTISLGRFLKQEEISLDILRKLSSPIYRTKLTLLGRVFDQDGQLYNDIIMASGSRLNTIERYLDSSQELLCQLRLDDSILLKQFKDVSEWMGDFTKISLAESNEILNK